MRGGDGGVRGGGAEQGSEGVERGDGARGDDAVELVLPVPRSQGTGGGDAEQWLDQDSVADAEQLCAARATNVHRFAQDFSGELQVLPFVLRHQNHAYHAVLTLSPSQSHHVVIKIACKM
ncbi:hypothetical protein JHK87_015268 [Glycine soja]|nr:hypothetical protein JHK87_015268 [Glycine soja]